MKNRKGFTLAELLIVVAIIAILVAISIPIFLEKLEQSREAVDIANLRDAYAYGQIQALSTQKGGHAWYDAKNGILKDSPTGINAYGKGTTLDTGNDYDLPDACTSFPAEASHPTLRPYDPAVDYTDMIIYVEWSGETGVKRCGFEK